MHRSSGQAAPPLPASRRKGGLVLPVLSCRLWTHGRRQPNPGPAQPLDKPQAHPIARWLRAALSGRDSLTLRTLLAVPIGLLAALATTVFRLAIEQTEYVLFGRDGDITELAAALPWYLCLLIPAAGGLVAALFLLWARQREQTDGQQDYMEAVSEGSGRIAPGSTLLRSLSSLASIASGGSIGREGAMVQLAALTGSLSGSRWAEPALLRQMTACGAAAGLASVYHAPLSGAIFVAEIVLGAISVDKLVPLFAAAVSASLLVGALGSDDAPFALVSQAASINAADWLLLAPMALLNGLAAPLFLRLLQAGKAAFRATGLAPTWQMTLGGLLMGLIAVFVPQVCGNGYAPIIDILGGSSAALPLALILLAKVAATACMVGSGAVGGIFTPSLFVGAALGTLCAGMAAQWHWLAHPDTAQLAMIGMAAFMAAVSHAPLMATLMVFEMSMNASLLLPLMAACVMAYTVSRALQPASLYEVLNRRHSRQTAVQAVVRHTMASLLEPAGDNLLPQHTLAQACAIFERSRTRYLYVVDEAGLLLGAVSMHRLAAYLQANPGDAGQAVSLMLEPDFPRLPKDAALDDAWQLFASMPLERLPIVASIEHPQLLGVVTKRAILEQARAFRTLAS